MQITLVRVRRAAVAVAAAGFVLIATASVGAGGSAPVDSYKDCLAKARTTVAVLGCNDAELRRVAAQLERVYGRLTKKLGPTRTRLLITAQVRWRSFRKAECRLSASVAAGGTLEPVIYGGCLIDLAVTRVKDLRAHLKEPA